MADKKPVDSQSEQRGFLGWLRQKRNAPLWVKIFVPLHIIAITSWALPDPPPAAPGAYKGISTKNPTAFFQSSAEFIRTGILTDNHDYVKMSPLRMYLLSSGFWQYWDMFSPNPASTDMWCDAIVTFGDGTTTIYHYPRIYDLSLGQKFLKERWRKFFERAGNDPYRYLWHRFALRIAADEDTRPNNPPVKVELRRHLMPISPPGAPENQTYSSDIYFTMFVPQDEMHALEGQ